MHNHIQEGKILITNGVSRLCHMSENDDFEDDFEDDDEDEDSSDEGDDE